MLVNTKVPPAVAACLGPSAHTLKPPPFVTLLAVTTPPLTKTLNPLEYTSSILVGANNKPADPQGDVEVFVSFQYPVLKALTKGIYCYLVRKRSY